MPSIRVTNPNAGFRAAIIYINLLSIVPTNELGDNKYVFKIHTRSRDVDGNIIEPIFVFETSIDGFFKSLPNAIAALCDKIYWGILNIDSDSPYVKYYAPVGNNVSLFSSVIVDIEDSFPSSGIDISSIKIKVNGSDVTNEAIVYNNFNSTRVSWSPKRRILNG